MNLANEYVLSFYKELTQISKEKNVIMLQHIESGDIFVKKTLEIYCKDVYMQLRDNPVEGTPCVIEVLEQEDKIIVIEEYVKGKTLQRLVAKNGVLSVQRALEYMEALTIIVEELHELTPPVIHRDIKPDNIILSDDGRIKLIDFNASKNISEDAGRDTHLLGTQNFAAPEQYGFGSSDVRTDVYGIGATFNYLLTQKYPNELIANNELHDILKKCLMISPDDRYQCMYDLFADIKALQKVSIVMPTVVNDASNNYTLTDVEPNRRKSNKKRLLMTIFISIAAFITTWILLFGLAFLYFMFFE